MPVPIDTETCQMVDCINLKETYGKRYRVEYEESYKAEFGEGAWRDDPWLQIIPCRYGHLYAYGENLIGVSVDGHRLIAGRIARLACTTVRQDGDDGELSASFAPEHFDAIAKIMRPRRRKQISEKERKRLREMGAATRFASDDGYKDDHSGSIASIGTEPDSQAVQGDERRSGAPQPSFTAAAFS